MISRVHSSILQGIDAVGCEVEADVVTSAEKPDIRLVGLAEKAVQESVSRIQAALRNSGYRWSGPKVTINLAPADVKKDSAALDLPIAIACMISGGQFFTEKIDKYLILGELALDGRVRPVKGSLAAAMLARRQSSLRSEASGSKTGQAAKDIRGVIVPAQNAAEAAVVDGLDVIAVNFLSDAVGFLTDELAIEPTVVDLEEAFVVAGRYDVDFSDPEVHRDGQESAKRALTVAAAGHHNFVLPGAAVALHPAPRAATVLRRIGAPSGA